MYDADLAAIQNPHTPPAQLADIAARRGDLHPYILNHPGCYPQLREWIARVNPGAGHYPIGMAAAPLAPPRRRGGGCFLIGCGGLALLAFGFVALLFIGAAVSSGGSDDGPTVQGPAVPGPTSDDPAVAEALALFDAEQARYHELAAQLEGNPAAPLVTRASLFANLEQGRADPKITASGAANIAREAQAHRQELEQRIADAAARSTNTSGTLSEALIDEAGAGFIDLVWDADTACGESTHPEGWPVAGCVTGSDPLAIHLDPADQSAGGMQQRVLVLHELAHVYQKADAFSQDDYVSIATDLVEQGYFQGSEEVMADCYALTYTNQWTLVFEDGAFGYGYVCSAEERHVIRDWAAQVNAPLP